MREPHRDSGGRRSHRTVRAVRSRRSDPLGCLREPDLRLLDTRPWRGRHGHLSPGISRSWAGAWHRPDLIGRDSPPGFGPGGESACV